MEENDRDALTMLNWAAPCKKINYFDLPVGEWTDAWKRDCPECREGLIVLMRSADSHKLMKVDRCCLCAQQFLFKDIDKMREKDGIK